MKTKTSLLTLVIVTIIVGIGSGLLGMALVLMLHYLQHLAYHYSLNQIISPEHFLEGVSAASPQRRVVVLFICGVIAGCGWWALYRFGKPLVSIGEAIKNYKKMPPLATIIHALLQIVTIALGSPLGREVAPRELGAIFATWIAQKTGLTRHETKIMLACGAGAGLAAVYNVPLGGAVFVMEVLLCTYSWSILLPALTTSAIATLVSWWGLGNESIYQIPQLSLNASLIIWSILTGPLFGLAAYGFMHIAVRQRAHALHDEKMILACLLNFTLIGSLAIYFPALLGNGKSPVQLTFDHSITLLTCASLLVLRVVIVWSSLKVGAQGGLLTPSLANGALLGAIFGELWSYLWPTSSLEAFAVVGSTAFLAAAQKMPLAAIILIFEFTHINFIFLVPIMLAVAGAVSTKHYCTTLNK